MLGRRVFSETCEIAAHRIAIASIAYDIPLEINLNGFHYREKSYRFYNRPNIFEKRYPYPFRKFWEIVSSYACKVLYGYDSYSPTALLEKNKEYKANEILKGTSLNFIENITLR